jgi:chemotaxis-related protein WspB
MLHVLCRIGRDAYAISCEAVERILPFAALKALPGGERGLTGLLNYRGQAVPVVDLCLLLSGEPAREMMNTRIVLCPLKDSASGWLGLLVEGVTKTDRLKDGDFASSGAAGDPCLGPVAPGRGGLIQRIEVPGILPDGLLASLGLPREFPA